MADDPPPKTSLPGQAGFAQRFMTKYGWKAGTGLGADSSGIVNPLRVQVEKRRRRADADGGGWADPANKAKIIGGKRAPGTDNGGGKFGPMSEVIVLRNMLDNMPDLQEEISAGLGQEIGEECGEKVRETRTVRTAEKETTDNQCSMVVWSGSISTKTDVWYLSSLPIKSRPCA